MIYADTSFLFSLYLHDANTAASMAFLKNHPTSLALTVWQQCELRNAIRLSVWRGNAAATDATRAQERITADIANGSLIDAPLVWPDLLSLAETLSAKHTVALGVRTLDLLHVAAAAGLNAKQFLTCDGRQLALARAAGLSGVKIVH